MDNISIYRYSSLFLVANIIDLEFNENEDIFCNRENGIIVSVRHSDDTPLWFEFLSGADVMHLISMATAPQNKDIFSVTLNPEFQNLNILQNIPKFHFFAVDGAHPYKSRMSTEPDMNCDMIMMFQPTCDVDALGSVSCPVYTGCVRLTPVNYPLHTESGYLQQGFISSDNLSDDYCHESWNYGKRMF